MKLYKGFDKNFKCRGFQYEVGKTYITDKPVELCNFGFHACYRPEDVLNFYTDRFAIVEMEPCDHDNIKVVSNKITIVKELSFDEFLKEFPKPKFRNILCYFNNRFFVTNKYSRFEIGTVLNETTGICIINNINWNQAKLVENDIFKLPTKKFIKEHFNELKQILRPNRYWLTGEYDASNAWRLRFLSDGSYPFFDYYGKSDSNQAFYIIDLTNKL